MKRNYLHLLIDILLLLGMIGLILTGLLMEFILPAGSHQSSVWALTRHEWGEIHFWIAMGIIATALLHVVLNWGWVCSVIGKMIGAASTRPTLRRKLWTGITTVAVLVVLVGGFLYAADAYKIEDQDGGQGGMGRGEGRGQGWRQLDQH